MNKVDILIYGCYIIPMNRRNVIENGAIAIKNGKIVYVGKAEKATGFEAEKKINGKGKAALPGLINCHAHVPMTLFRGVAEDQPLKV
ncbi:hypothetical protein J7L33_06660 [Candidatus Bathyarchaeota archaeon]|nr:hypothetical protein [Candidatus Bathyarchaeota archaeon]